MSDRNKLRILWTLVILLVGLLFVTYSNAQNDNDLIHACVNNQNGATRIVDSRRNCTLREHHVAWRQSGFSGYEVAYDPLFQSDYLNGWKDYIIECPDGKTALSGGWWMRPSKPLGPHYPDIVRNMPVMDNPQQWMVTLMNDEDPYVPMYSDIVVFAVCAYVNPL